jgi:hypothetical protein
MPRCVLACGQETLGVRQAPWQQLANRARLWQRGAVPAHQLPAGTVLGPVPPVSPAVRSQTVAVAARVSSAEHCTHRDRQAARGERVAPGGTAYGAGVTALRPQCRALRAATSSSHRVAAEHTGRCWAVWGWPPWPPGLPPDRAHRAGPSPGERAGDRRGTATVAAGRRNAQHPLLCLARWPQAGAS